MRPKAKPKRKTAVIALGFIATLLAAVLWVLGPLLISLGYEVHSRATLRLDGKAFVLIQANGEPTARMSATTFLGGLEVDMSSFHRDELVVVIEAKRWSWLPLPDHRSYFQED